MMCRKKRPKSVCLQILKSKPLLQSNPTLTRPLPSAGMYVAAAGGAAVGAGGPTRTAVGSVD
eukprot:283026-Chlamydomonas_euryale.AAC.3